MAMPPVTTAAELWQRLVTSGGLQPGSWDADLVAELRTLLALPPPRPLAESLADAKVSSEIFLSAFFASVAGYADMLEALLAFLGRRGASADADAIAIEFDFGKAKLPFTASELERLRRRVQRVVSATVLAYRWDNPSYWTFKGLLQDVMEDLDLPRRDMDYRVDRDTAWPAPARTHAPIDHARLDRQLADVWAVWRSVVRDCSERAETPTRLLARSGHDAHGQVLAGLVSDLYLEHLEICIDAIADGRRTGALDDDGAEILATRLEDFFATHPPEPIDRRSAINAFDDFLDLPVWKQRHELYATWVLTEIADACPRGVSLRLSDEGVLRLPFRATAVADVVGCDPPLQLWAELRTPLSHPRGKKRKGAIQPDFSILAMEDDAPPDLRSESGLLALADRSILEVECKQYRRPAREGFAAAIEDYARGRPNARTILASHGPLDPARLLQHVPPQYRPRANAIPLLSPRQLDSRGILHDAVVAAVEPHLTPLPVPVPDEPAASDTASPVATGRRPLPPAAELVLLVTLTWRTGPRDLDLRLIADADAVRVDHRHTGALDRPPFALLDCDDLHGPGCERIGVARWVARRYVICVEAYNSDSSFAASDAEVLIELGGHARRIACPSAESPARWWHVATIDVEASPRVTIVDTLRAYEPDPTS